jgi:hypothetical protein
MVLLSMFSESAYFSGTVLVELRIYRTRAHMKAVLDILDRIGGLHKLKMPGLAGIAAL